MLAALSTVAVPDLDAVDVRRASHPGPGIDAAVVIDATGGRWVARAPRDATAGAALEAEVALLMGLGTYADSGALPFAVPRLAGAVVLPEGGRAVVHRQLPGRPIRLEELGPGPGLAAALGRAIAAIHELPVSVVENAGLPVYDADTYRRRRLTELDEAARTGHVPAFLLRRWERALEDVSLWRFQPTVVHGDLSSEHVLVADDEPVGILGWSETKVADPADDLAWLLVAAPQPAVDPIIEAYHLRRTELRDPHLATRALLAGELAVARWLMHGINTDDDAVVADARSMLGELVEHLTRYEQAAAAAAGPADAETDDAWEDDPIGRLGADPLARPGDYRLEAEDESPSGRDPLGDARLGAPLDDPLGYEALEGDRLDGEALNGEALNGGVLADDVLADAPDGTDPLEDGDGPLDADETDANRPA